MPPSPAPSFWLVHMHETGIIQLSLALVLSLFLSLSHSLSKVPSGRRFAIRVSLYFGIGQSGAASCPHEKIEVKIVEWRQALEFRV